ncbi:MAG TPA: ectonucleotide pyrophosphatase/phosphodiesterase [Bryobacteraceae bacterium]|nr:ectonucleotide pyrophosphatase/phosphodiesterase [Bryobacteraceae bacterium]
MNKILPTILVSALAFAQPNAADRHVIVISLDGFPAYALHDRTIPLPVLRELSRTGAVAEAMTPVNPTVTWPNHTSMVTGVGPDQHGVIYNGLPVRDGDGKPVRVEEWVDKAKLVTAPTVYDAAHEAGLTTAEVDWVAIYHARSIDWSFAEIPSPDGTIEREMLASGEITDQELRSWNNEPITLRDDVWTRAAVHIIEKHKPNLCLFHLLTTDSVQHQDGARTLAANTALILADRQIRRILDAADRAGISSSTTILVVSDHGFTTYRHVIRVNALLREKGLLHDDSGQIACAAWAVAEGGTAMVYFTRASQRETTSHALQEMLPHVPGIARIIMPADYSRFGYPSDAGKGRMADMVVVAAPGYAFDGGTTGDVVTDVPKGASPGAHGFLNSDPDMAAILVAWGAGIRPGVHLPVIRNTSVAPTIAKLLDLGSFESNAPVPDGLIDK